MEPHQLMGILWLLCVISILLATEPGKNFWRGRLQIPALIIAVFLTPMMALLLLISFVPQSDLDQDFLEIRTKSLIGSTINEILSSKISTQIRVSANYGSTECSDDSAPIMITVENDSDWTLDLVSVDLKYNDKSAKLLSHEENLLVYGPIAAGDVSYSCHSQPVIDYGALTEAELDKLTLAEAPDYISLGIDLDKVQIDVVNFSISVSMEEYDSEIDALNERLNSR